MTDNQVHTSPKHKRSVIKRVIAVIVCLVVLFIGFSVAANAWVVLSTRSDVHTIAQIDQSDMKAEAVVVLGASVYSDGTPSDILADRLEVASDLYLSGAVKEIIVSGDNRDTHYNESDAMKAYCISQGVPADDIVVDHAGYDTYSSIYRAKHVYGADSIMVVTQAYHLYRALAIAHGLGMQAVGVAADKGTYDNQTMYSIREIIARDKDFIKTVLRIAPEDPDQPMTK